MKAAEKRSLAFQLKKKGTKVDDIASTLGVSTRMVHKYIRTEIDRLRDENTEDAQYLIDMEDARLDDILFSISTNGTPNSVKSNNIKLKVSESRRKLHGINAPDKVDIKQSGKVEVTFDNQDTEA